MNEPTPQPLQASRHANPVCQGICYRHEARIRANEACQNRADLTKRANNLIPKKMKSRSIIYWITSSALALLATHAAYPAGAPAAQDLPVIANSAIQTASSITDPSRAIMLFAGIMAMAFTYHRAWQNWRAVPVKS